VIVWITTGRNILTGIYRSVRELAIAQRALGVEVHIVCEGSWPDDDIQADGVQVHEGGTAESFRRIRSLASPGAVVHTHTLWRSLALAPLLTGRREGVAAVLSPHNCLAGAAMAFKSAKKLAAWRLIFRHAVSAHDLVVATVEQERIDALSFTRSIPTAVLPNAAPPPSAVKLQGVARTRTVGFLGRIHPIKGVLELARAWGTVAPPGWRLRIVGPVEDEAYARAVRGFADIEPPLYGDDKWRFLASCGLVVMPSKTEGFANATAESYLAGTPVLACMSVPWSDIEQRRMGWRGDDLAAMLRAATALSEQERARMGAVGRAFVGERYSPPIIAAQSLRIYEAARAARFPHKGSRRSPERPPSPARSRA